MPCCHPRDTVIAMTTTDESGGFTPPPAPPSSTRVLRRSRSDRVGAGVSGGLGEYFGVDPVLFRVLFATAAFFGGAGVLAYLVAWAAIPEQGTTNAPIDRFIGELRRRRVPVWLVASVAGLVLWGVAFSWWAPGPVFPVMVIVIVLVAIFGRHGRTDERTAVAAPAGPQEPGTVNLAKEGDAQPATDPNSPAWVRETRQWITEAKAASRLRRRRAMPVRLATLGTLVVTLAILALIDGASGLALPVYFWVTLGIVGLGLITGMVLRRTPWTLAVLLVPAIIGVVGFAGSDARLHDGFGAREWSPSSAADIQSNYRLAFGQAKLDLRNVGQLDTARIIHVILGAGQARILLPSTMNATVHANVHFGDVQLDGSDLGDNHGGFNLNRTIRPPAGATGPAVTIDVDVTDGQISVARGN
jgi:phage shock protein PspC (stress-responsive transcriptional regulator)